jgi:hypothetical protein
MDNDPDGTRFARVVGRRRSAEPGQDGSLLARRRTVRRHVRDREQRLRRRLEPNQIGESAKLGSTKPYRPRGLVPPTSSAVARRPRVRFVFTPTHGSWLNQVEIWFGILTRGALRHPEAHHEIVILPAIRPSPAVSSSANSIPPVNGRVRPAIFVACAKGSLFWGRGTTVVASYFEGLVKSENAERRLEARALVSRPSHVLSRQGC